MKHELKCLSWNVNGLRAAAKRVCAIGYWSKSRIFYACRKQKCTGINCRRRFAKVPGYHSYFVAAERPGYSGVALYSKIEPNRIRVGLGVEEFDREGRVLIADYNDFSLLNCYFPNGGASAERLDYKMRFYEELLRFLAGEPPTIVCGDVNTAHEERDLARPKENSTVSGFLPQERQWIDRFLASGYADTFRMFHEETADIPGGI